uniref:Exportin-4 n=1 Tax=Caenorhabditis tropicalis TaxID=1561998 RepID=A0A1I7TQK1_9PELO
MDLSTIETFAETLLAPPNLVTGEAREQATYFFEDLKKKITINECLILLRESKNPFVLFQIGQAVGEIVLRDWSLIEANDVQVAYKTLLEFVATSLSLESYVTGACLKSSAMIIKRGILDGKSGDQEELYQFIHQMLTNESSTIQAAGCLFISALIEQFSSAWRNSKFSITWDFHLQAKSTFENNGLRRLLEISLTTLHALSNQEDIVGNSFTRRLCDRFLEVSENILSWNFSSKLYRRFLSNHQVRGGKRRKTIKNS